MSSEVASVTPFEDVVAASRARLRLSSVLAATTLLVVSVVLGVALGPVDLPLSGVARELLGLHSGLAVPAIVWEIRLPRVVLGVLVGATLACTGCGYQGVFRNPLVDPYLLGTAAGAGLGATLAIVFAPGANLGPIDLLPLAAFAGAILAVWLAWSIARSVGHSAATLLLAGVAVASFLTALQTYVQQHHVETLQTVYDFILGSLGKGDWSDVRLLLPYSLISIAVLVAHGRVLDVLAIGDLEAASLGVNVRRVRLVVVAAATIGTAAAVAVSGLIGFVGLVVPHTIRLLVGSGSMRVLLPLSALTGGAFLVACDLAARTLEAGTEIPIGVITAFFGAPFFAFLLRNARGAFE